MAQRKNFSLTFGIMILILMILMLVSCSNEKKELTRINLPTPTKNIILTHTVTQSTPSIIPVITQTISLTPSLQVITPKPSLLFSTDATISPSPLRIIPSGWIALWGERKTDSEEGYFLIHSDGTGFQPIIKDKNYFYHTFSWSPDGQWLVFSAEAQQTGNQIGGIPQLFIVRTDGSNLRQITSGESRKYSPSWSPNGNDIVYSETPSLPLSQQYLVLIDQWGTKYKRLTNTVYLDDFPTWSPDGSKIAFLRQYGSTPEKYNVYLMDADGSHIELVSETFAERADLAWSPDGKQLIFRPYSTCSFTIVNLNDKSVRQLSNNKIGYFSPRWSPDGQYIVFSGVGKCDKFLLNPDLYYMKADGSEITPILYHQDLDYDLSVPEWSPVPGLQRSESYIITELGSNLNLRNKFTLKGELLKKLKQGDIITVLDGPLYADNYYWWKMKTMDGIIGWAVDVFGWYQKQQP